MTGPHLTTEATPDAEIAFGFTPKPYAFVAAAFGAAVIPAALAWIARRDADPIAIPLAATVPAILLAWPGLASLWLLSRSPRFRIGAAGVEMTSWRWRTRTLLPFDAILGIESRLLRSDRAQRAAIAVASDRRRIRIPRWIEGNGREALDAILARTWRARKHRHMPLRPEGPGAEAEEMPKAIREAIEIWKLRGPDAPVYLFRGPVRKALRRRLPFFVGSAILAAIGAACLVLSGGDESLEHFQAYFFAAAAVGGIGMVTLCLPLRMAVRRSWLLVSSRGVLLCSRSGPEEFVWPDVETIGKRSVWQVLADQNSLSRHTFKSEEFLPQLMMLHYFLVAESDGRRITIFDIYDAPLPAIEALCRRFHEARSEEASE
ncbi:MAG: hypothetical protein JXP34_09450 [Planctomycetes bacterium]|nr:hypothetical protein [Planctomycetota bacterium]